MIAILLAVVLAWSPAPNLPTRGTASWYGARCPAGTFLNRTDTCSPYLSIAQGGRGGEQWYYAAVGDWSFGDRPYRILVCRADDPTRCVKVTVRDYCGRCAADLERPWGKRSRAIDLSPLAFAKLEALGRGLVRVTLTRILPSSNTESPSMPGPIAYR